MVNKTLQLTIDGKTYRVDVPGPGMISVDGNVFQIEMTPNGVKVNDKPVVCSLSPDFAVVAGKLYSTGWKTD